MEIQVNPAVAKYIDAKIGDHYVLTRFKVNDSISFGITDLDPLDKLSYMAVLDESSQNVRFVQLSLDNDQVSKLRSGYETSDLGSLVGDKIGTDNDTFPNIKKIMSTEEGLTVEDRYGFLPKMTIVSEGTFKRAFDLQVKKHIQ